MDESYTALPEAQIAKETVEFDWKRWKALCNKCGAPTLFLITSVGKREGDKYPSMHGFSFCEVCREEVTCD